MMKFIRFANLSLIIIIIIIFQCFGAIYLDCKIWSRPIALVIFSFLPLFINLCITPGGFAWQNYKNPTKFCGGFICSWPLLGLLPTMASSHAHRKLAVLATSVGAQRLMAFSVGANRVIISSHPDTAKEILCGNSFSDRPIKQSARLLMFERAIGFAPSGKYWLHLRRIAANHMFSPRRISSLEGLRQHVVNCMIEEVLKETNEKGVVELRSVLKFGSLNHVLETVFGSDVNNLGLEDLGAMVNEGYELISEFNLADYFPLGFLDFGGVKKKCHRLAGNVTSLISRIIKERKALKGDFEMKNDFLSVWLSLPKEDQLNDEDLVAVLWEMVFRGTDTVAILLEWIMARMVLHQDIQAKAQHEIDTRVGQSRPLHDSDIPHLPYLQAIVKETLRVHPPGPLLSWARLAIHDVHIDKLLIPAGTTAMVNMWAITHDSANWKDPWTFMPERFLKTDISIMGSDLRLAPFGSGRRACPGKALGLSTVQLWLGRLLQQFKWAPSGEVDLSECLKLSLEMQKPLVCHATDRHGIIYKFNRVL